MTSELTDDYNFLAEYWIDSTDHGDRVMWVPN